MTYAAAIQSIPMPDRIRRLPVCPKIKMPVPYFVAWPDGSPDFRMTDAAKLTACVQLRRCWICGEQLGRNMAFIVGPLAAINRIYSEPPSHLECATYAVRACPFMVNPRMRRNEVDLPTGAVPAAPGIAIKRNPGVNAIWLVRSYSTFRPPDGGVLFDIGEPEQVLWFAQGRHATRKEIDASINAGVDALIALATAEGPSALAELGQQAMAAERYMPAA